MKYATALTLALALVAFAAAPAHARVINVHTAAGAAHHKGKMYKAESSVTKEMKKDGIKKAHKKGKKKAK